MDVHIGADHAGFVLKQELIKYIAELGHRPVDIGAFELDENDDYPDLAIKLKVISDSQSDLVNFRGILVCGSGLGMAMAANKIKGVRAASGNSPEQIFFGRLHNDINVLCLAGLRSNVNSIERVTDGDYSNLIDAGMNTANVNEAKRMLKVFLSTETQATPGSRHRRRIEKIASME